MVGMSGISPQWNEMHPPASVLAAQSQPYSGFSNPFGQSGGSPSPGIDWGQIGSSLGNVLGTGAGLYGAYSNAQQGQNTLNASNTGYGMASGAYNPSLFSSSGVGGTGSSVSSPTNGGPGSINSSLGAMNPMYGAYAGAAGGFLGQSQGLANTAQGGATGAYQSALASIMPQLQQMQGNLLSANNNALFQRGQMGSGSFGQNTAGGENNPVNLTTQSLGSGFAQQDLNAITAAQNQGLNFFNSNLQGAGALGNLGMGATNTGLGMIGAQNSMQQNPLAYAGLYGNQQIGATNAMSGMVGSVAGRNGALQAAGGGMGGFAQGFANGAGPNAGPGSNPLGAIGNLINGGRTLYNAMTGGPSQSGTPDTSPGFSLADYGVPSGGSFNPGFDTMGGSTSDPFASGNMSTGFSPGDYGSAGFNGAGGQAATGSAQQAASATPGQAGSGISNMLGSAMNVGNTAMGMYNGMKQGGVMGYGTAAIDAGKLANMSGAANVPGLGPASAVLSTYSAIKNWQSGNTGSDAIQGAEAGAAWGSLFGPVGTVAGAVIGGAVGALSSAFGGGRPDLETGGWNNYAAAYNKADPATQSAMTKSLSPSQAYQNLAGVMDAKNNTPGHSEPIEQVFGRMGENNLMTALTGQLNQDLKSGAIKPGDSIKKQWDEQIYPWLKSKGATIDPNQTTSKGDKEGQALIDNLQSLMGSWEGGMLTSSTKVGINGQTISGLQRPGG